MSTCRPAPTFTITRLANTWRGPKFRFDATGWLAPVGKTVRYELALAFATVRLRTTPATPKGCTPPRPVTWRWITPAGPSGRTTPPVPVPFRVSSRRAGTTGLKRPSAPRELSVTPTQPATSKITWAVPAALYAVTWPFVPTATSTRFATVPPELQFRFEAVGCRTPAGNSVR